MVISNINYHHFSLSRSLKRWKGGKLEKKNMEGWQGNGWIIRRGKKEQFSPPVFLEVAVSLQKIKWIKCLYPCLMTTHEFALIAIFHNILFKKIIRKISSEKCYFEFLSVCRTSVINEYVPRPHLHLEG